MKRFLLTAAVLLAACSCGRKPFIDVQAHRGGAGLMPENTIPAMKNAIDLGVNTVEFDLQVTSDGKVVVNHDAYFHPRYATRPDGTLISPDDPKEYLFTMPYDSVLKYDVGLRENDRWPTQQHFAVQRPLASELIDFVEEYGKGKLRYNIEIKSCPDSLEGIAWPEYHAFVDACVPVLLEKKLGDRLVVQSFDTRALEYMHEKYPQLILSYLTEGESTDVEDWMSKLSFKPVWWSPESIEVTPENVEWCHRNGIKVVPWTVDEPEEMQRLVDCGVEAIISNYPDILISVVR